MSGRNPETILAAWFEDGPTVLPIEVRQSIASALPGARRARVSIGLDGRVGWPPTRRATLAAASIAVVLTLGVLALGTGPTGPAAPASATPTSTPAAATPTPTATPSLPHASIDIGGWGTFTSDRNGIRFGVPQGWQVQAATDTWGPQARPSPWQLDQAMSPNMLGFIVASRPVGGGLADATWWPAPDGGASFADMACGRGPASSYVAIVVDGLPSHELTTNWCDVVITLAGDRAYLIEAWAELEKPGRGTVDTELFEAWLTTVHFDPANANAANAEPSGTHP
jgi:hypothetical protein